MKVCVDALMFTSTTDFCPAKTAVPPRYVAGAVELRAWLQPNVEPYKEMMTMTDKGCTPCLPCFEWDPATDGFDCETPQCKVRCVRSCQGNIAFSQLSRGDYSIIVMFLSCAVALAKLIYTDGFPPQAFVMLSTVDCFIVLPCVRVAPKIRTMMQDHATNDY